jgi:ribosome-associated toxin RatA of RatAB toxin-antitoxin module
MKIGGFMDCKQLLKFAMRIGIVSAFLFVGFVGIPMAGASMADALSREQRDTLAQGGTVVTSREIPKQAWPELTLYRVVHAKPKQVFDLFNDYESAPSYTPGMIKAEVIAQPEPKAKDVRYTVKMPVLGNISYIVRNFYSQKGSTYEVSWELVESPMASASNGALTIEPHEGKTLLRYRNHVTPSVPLAGALKGQARKEAETTIKAIGGEAERRAQKAAGKKGAAN